MRIPRSDIYPFFIILSVYRASKQASKQECKNARMYGEFPFWIGYLLLSFFSRGSFAGVGVGGWWLG